MAIKEKNLTETVCIYIYKSRRSLHSKRPWRNFFRDFHTFQMTSTTRNFCLDHDRKLKLEKKKKCDMYDQFFFLQWIIICILYTIDELVLAELWFEIDIVVPAEMHLCFGGRRSALFFGRNLKSEVRFLMRTQNVFFLAPRSWWDGKIHLCSLINKNVVYDQCVTLSCHFKIYPYFLMINTNYFFNLNGK